MIAALLLAAGPVAERDCGILPQQPMNACFAQQFRRLEAQMNAQWKITAEALKSSDRTRREDDGQPSEFETALAAQRAWLTYRDAHCLGASFGARGGSLQPTLDSTCKIELTKERIRQLKALVDGEN